MSIFKISSIFLFSVFAIFVLAFIFNQNTGITQACSFSCAGLPICPCPFPSSSPTPSPSVSPSPSPTPECTPTPTPTPLKIFEGFNDLETTGFFDQKTFDYVSIFQEKYSGDVLETWGLTGSTGYVYITTKKKINEIFCKREFSLTSDQRVEIDSFRGLLRQVVESGVPALVLPEVGVAPETEQGNQEIAVNVKEEIPSAGINQQRGLIGRLGNALGAASGFISKNKLLNEGIGSFIFSPAFNLYNFFLPKE